MPPNRLAEKTLGNEPQININSPSELGTSLYEALFAPLCEATINVVKKC